MYIDKKLWEKLKENIDNGNALNKLKEFVLAQGGDVSYIDDTSKFESAKYKIEVIAESNGMVTKINAQEVGIIAMEIGAGRATKEDKIDLSVGIVFNKKCSDKVKEGDILAVIYANDKDKGEKARQKLLKNIIKQPITGGNFKWQSRSLKEPSPTLTLAPSATLTTARPL